MSFAADDTLVDTREFTRDKELEREYVFFAALPIGFNLLLYQLSHGDAAAALRTMRKHDGAEQVNFVPFGVHEGQSVLHMLGLHYEALNAAASEYSTTGYTHLCAELRYILTSS